MKPVKGFLCLALSIFLLCESAFAQGQNQTSARGKKEFEGQMTPILVGGVLGMAIGVSSLSFYGRPQKRLGNVAYGTALGIIFGAAYSLYVSASRQFRHLEYRGNQEVREEAPLFSEAWQNLSATEGVELYEKPWMRVDVLTF